MKRLPYFRCSFYVSLPLFVWGVLASTLLGQGIVFSVDVQGPTAGSFGSNVGPLDGSFGQEISGADLLTATRLPSTVPPQPAFPGRGPGLPTPSILVFGRDVPIPNSRSLGLQFFPIGTRPELELELELELDALSFGRDDGRGIYFSVDEFANGIAGDVAIQTASAQVSADLFRAYFGQPSNHLVIDGAGGEAPNVALGFGLFEPNTPGPGVDEGDNVDAVDVNALPHDLERPVYFSLDSAFPDPNEPNIPNGPNLGSAQQNGFSGADILMASPGQPPQVFIPAQLLGLNPMFDDVDALAFFDAQEDGMFNEGDDVLFSVRRGSQVLGQIDSLLGIPIGPGDILGPPAQPGQPPAVIVPAEDLGLQPPPRGNVRPVSDPLADDLDALSLGRQDGDMNCNFEWDPADVLAFASALESHILYDERHPFCGSPVIHGDLSLDGRFDYQDKERFIEVMANAGTLHPDEIRAMFRIVPEPQRPCLVVFIAMLAMKRGRQSA